jgi:hypothetical protein
VPVHYFTEQRIILGQQGNRSDITGKPSASSSTARLGSRLPTRSPSLAPHKVGLIVFLVPLAASRGPRVGEREAWAASALAMLSVWRTIPAGLAAAGRLAAPVRPLLPGLRVLKSARPVYSPKRTFQPKEFASARGRQRKSPSLFDHLGNAAERRGSMPAGLNRRLVDLYRFTSTPDSRAMASTKRAVLLINAE